jgi:hypothetical protein
MTNQVRTRIRADRFNPYYYPSGSCNFSKKFTRPSSLQAEPLQHHTKQSLTTNHVNKLPFVSHSPFRRQTVLNPSHILTLQTLHTFNRPDAKPNCNARPQSHRGAIRPRRRGLPRWIGPPPNRLRGQRVQPRNRMQKPQRRERNERQNDSRVKDFKRLFAVARDYGILP